MCTRQWSQQLYMPLVGSYQVATFLAMAGQVHAGSKVGMDTPAKYNRIYLSRLGGQYLVHSLQYLNQLRMKQLLLQSPLNLPWPHFSEAS